MKNNIALSPTFWSGVINYVRASAQTAEALKPRGSHDGNKVKTVLVFKTSVDGFPDQLMVTGRLDEIVGENNWTIDLDDEDRVLRVVCEEGSNTEIIEAMTAHGFICELMT